MRAFVRVAELCSFSRVARELKVAQSTVSKEIVALEQHLGVRLLSRTARSLSLTDEGLQFYKRSREILDALAEAKATVGAGRTSASGFVRIGCPATFGRLLTAPRLGRLLRHYPDLRVEIVMSDAFVDLVEARLDVAVRIGALGDQAPIARKVASAFRAAFAVPSYIAERGQPDIPYDVREHNCIVSTHLGGAHRGNEWRFIRPPRRLNGRVRGHILANNAEVVREAVLAGIGLAVAPPWMFHREAAAGLVTTVLGDYELEHLPIHLVYPSRRLITAKVRALSDFLAEEFRAEPALIGGGGAAPTASAKAIGRPGGLHR
jgi:DNA-binding transcriptional LysR family regulator